MSIIVNGMEMPKGCFFCPLVGGDFRCRISHLDVSQHTMRRHSACPLVEIPTEHGRLIDADMLDTAVMNMNDAFPYNITRNDYTLVKRVLNHIPTVVPAEKGGAE